jgi:hypothetical protein
MHCTGIMETFHTCPSHRKELSGEGKGTENHAKGLMKREGIPGGDIMLVNENSECAAAILVPWPPRQS